MVDPNNRQLRPPIHRSWLRLRLGKLYYGGRRRLLWMSPRFHWAKQRQTERLPYMLISHATPLYRRIYDLEGGLLVEEFLFVNDAIMMYSPLLPEES